MIRNEIIQCDICKSNFFIIYHMNPLHSYPTTFYFLFQAELRKFVMLEQEILSLETNRNIGALRLNTSLLKPQLCNESKQWKVRGCGIVCG